MKVIIPVLLLLSAPLQAEVYKTVTPDGEVIYSDVRTAGAKQLNKPKPQTYTPAPIPEQNSPVPNGVAETKTYTSFLIDSPLADTTIRNNLGNVELLLTLEPVLIAKDGHRIEYYLDGKPYGRRTADIAKTYVNVDRGEHELSASVVDDKGVTLISTQPVTVYLHRSSKQHPFNPLNPNNPNKKPPLPPNTP